MGHVGWLKGHLQRSPWSFVHHGDCSAYAKEKKCLNNKYEYSHIVNGMQYLYETEALTAILYFTIPSKSIVPSRDSYINREIEAKAR